MQSTKRKKSLALSLVALSLTVTAMSFGIAVFAISEGKTPESKEDSKSDANETPPLAPASEKKEAEKQNEQHLYSALYDLSESGWTGTPLSIDAIDDSSKSTPTPTVFEGAELIKEFGVIECARRTFSRGQRQIRINLYRFQTSDGAYGAYLGLRRGSTNTIQRGDASSEDDRSISFWKDKYFASVFGTSEADDESMEVVTKFANKLAKTLTVSSAEPALLSRLPLIDRVKGSEKIVMGPISLRRAFSAPYADTFYSTRIIDGAVSDYQTVMPDRERLKLMLLRYETPEAANSVYLKYVGQMQDQHKLQTTDFYLPQSSIFKMSGTFLFCQLRNSELLVVTGARKKPSLTYLARQVY